MSTYDYESDSFINQMITKRDTIFGHVFTLRNDDDSLVHINMSDPRLEDGKYITGYNCTYNYIFGFEENHDPYYYINLVGTYRWMAKWFMLVYLGGIYFLKKYMKNRPKYDLRVPLVLWNLSLALLSTWGALRACHELLQVINNYGFKFSICFAGKP